MHLKYLSSKYGTSCTDSSVITHFIDPNCWSMYKKNTYPSSWLVKSKLNFGVQKPSVGFSTFCRVHELLNWITMVVTLETKLPSEEELTMPELKLSAPALRAGAFHLGKYCQDSFNVSALLKWTKKRFSFSAWRNQIANGHSMWNYGVELCENHWRKSDTVFFLGDGNLTKRIIM